MYTDDSCYLWVMESKKTVATGLGWGTGNQGYEAAGAAAVGRKFLSHSNSSPGWTLQCLGTSLGGRTDAYFMHSPSSELCSMCTHLQEKVGERPCAK